MIKVEDLLANKAQKSIRSVASTAGLFLSTAQADPLHGSPARGIDYHQVHPPWVNR